MFCLHSKEAAAAAALAKIQRQRGSSCGLPSVPLTFDDVVVPHKASPPVGPARSPSSSPVQQGRAPVLSSHQARCAPEAAASCVMKFGEFGLWYLFCGLLACTYTFSKSNYVLRRFVELRRIIRFFLWAALYVSSVQYPVFSIQCPVSSVQYPVVPSCPVPSAQCPVSVDPAAVSSIQYPVSSTVRTSLKQ